ncbi:MAG: phosphatidylserine decarboxylase [Burkholderiales bacterium]|nr:phosphatidylserine decarboxylase [Burkholderiales bacterium]
MNTPAWRRWRDRLLLQEDLNFLLTNRVPRLALTRFMRWFSKIEQPLVRDLSIALWKTFSDVDFADALKPRFRSLHDAFIRELRPGARPFDPDPGVLASPCDAIVGACGDASGTEIWQAKGFNYRLEDLFGSRSQATTYRDGCFVTLRLTAGMYHRFHAPADLVVRHVTHLVGDTWNVNPIALQRVERLFCRNERAAIHATLLDDGMPVALVPVAAILVASLRLHVLDRVLNIDHPGPHEFDCDATVARGQEMGWFEHGSTVIVFAPKGCTLAPTIHPGQPIRAGQALIHRPSSPWRHCDAE